MNYFYYKGNLSNVMDFSRSNPWPHYGFETRQIAKAVQQGFQQQEEDGEMVSIFPIANEVIFYQAMESAMAEEPDICKVMAEDAAIAERDRLKEINDAKAEAAKNIPSEEDTYRAQELLLLTQISNKLSAQNNTTA